jgi:2-polyprenyl-3-methyl-5-hydroxy-6-metoxy-1,4-benzoquinol methylase
MTTDVTQLPNKPVEYYENPRKEMLKYIPQGTKTTLEFGCGNGNFSELIKNEYHAECWGVEMHPHYAKKASEKLDNVINAEAHQVLNQIPENYFDCIIFNDVLEHLKDPYSLLREVKSKLNKYGVVVASIPNVRFWSNLKALVIDGMWDYKDTGILDKTHLRFFTYNSLIKIFRQLDYNIVAIEGLHPTHSTTFKILNTLLFNKLKDARYRQFACVIKPESGSADV